MKVHRFHRDLPHWHRQGSSAIYWITFRLADSLPQEKVQLLKKERERFLLRHPKPWTPEIENIYRERFNERIHDWLDAGHGSCTLADPEMRSHLVDAIMKFEGVRHSLVSAVIMPNHVHMILRPTGYSLGLLLQGIKATSARKINELTGHTGIRFWMEESYDRIIRSKEELNILREYVRRNPRNLPENRYWLFDREPPFVLKSDPGFEVLYAMDSE